MRSAKPTIRALTGLRFFAAMHVLLLHAAAPLMSDQPVLLRNLVGSGYVGVSFFFVLSGFILTYNYVDEAGEIIVRARSFWMARFARVVPVYLVGLIVWMPIFVREVLLANGQSLSESVPAILGGTLVASLFLQAWSPTAVYFLNPPGWSLSVEAFFYALFPVLVRPLRRLTPHGMLATAGFLWVATLTVSMIYLVLNPDGVGAGSAEIQVFWLDALKFNPLVRLPEFVIGMVAGRFFLMKKQLGWLTPAGHAALGFSLIFVALLFSSFIPYPLLHNGLLAPLYAYFIFSLASNQGLIATFLSIPFMVLLGEASYSLYLLHLPVARWMEKGVKVFGASIAPIPFVALYIITAILTSILALRFIEEPARKRIRLHISQYRGKPA